MQPDEAGEVRMISLNMPGSTSSGTALAALQPHMPPAILLQASLVIPPVLDGRDFPALQRHPGQRPDDVGRAERDDGRGPQQHGERYSRPFTAPTMFS